MSPVCACCKSTMNYKPPAGKNPARMEYSPSQWLHTWVNAISNKIQQFRVAIEKIITACTMHTTFLMGIFQLRYEREMTVQLVNNTHNGSYKLIFDLAWDWTRTYCELCHCYARTPRKPAALSTWPILIFHYVGTSSRMCLLPMLKRKCY